MMAALILASALAIGADAPQFEVRLLEGPPVRGEIIDWQADALQVATSSEQQTIPLERVLELNAVERPTGPSYRPQAWVDLTDGSRLLALRFEITDGIVRVELISGERVEFDAAELAEVRLQPFENDDGQQQQWEQVPRDSLATDLIVVRREDALDYIEGVAHDVTAERVVFEIEGEQLPIRREKVAGLIYYHPTTSGRPDPQALVYDASGGKLAAAALGLDAGKLSVTTVTGLQLAQTLSVVRRIDFSGGKLVYLSDLDWLERESGWTPYIAVASLPESLKDFYAPRLDRGFHGPLLELAGRSYRKGLALQSRTELVYRLSEPFRRFEAIAGIDDAHGLGGHVRFIVEADGQPLYTAEIRGGDPPLPVSLDVAGVRKLRIVVDYGDDLDVADCLNLCDARLLK